MSQTEIVYQKIILKVPFKGKPKFLAWLWVISAYHELLSEILGFLNHIRIDDLNICLDFQYTRIFDGFSEINQWSYSTTQRTPQKCQQN